MPSPIVTLSLCALLLLTASPASQARIKLVALPEREATVVRLDHPEATLVEEERVLTLQQGRNQVDFSWRGVRIDPDSIRLTILDHPGETLLVNVSYPPRSQSLVWEIASPQGRRERVRISYLLHGIDRVVTYEGSADQAESRLDLRTFLVLRNFSGEALDDARFQLDHGQAFEKSIADGETKRLLFQEMTGLPLRKRFTFDAALQPWDPAREQANVGIPVHYELDNTAAGGLGRDVLWDGKARLFQDDGHGATIFLGEDQAGFTPVGETLELYIGDSRDLVVTQRKTAEQRSNVRRNKHNAVVLYDSEEAVTVTVENFKDQPAELTLLQPMDGEWEITQSSHPYERNNAGQAAFGLAVPARDTVTVSFRYRLRNIRAEAIAPLPR